MRKRVTLDSLMSGAEAPAQKDRPAPPQQPSGALRAMTASLEHLASGAAEADRLREELRSTERIVSIDPGLIDGSFVRDRLPGDDGLDDLAASIEQSGQQVPVLVRPSSKDEGRFELAYGHRRVAAARRLGRPVLAIVRGLTDDQLVVAQGKENLERQDLSYIERAQFARDLEDRGFPRQTIISALGVAKSEVSMMISVARQVPEEVISLVGRSPRVGRPRWLAAVEAFRDRTPDEIKAVVEAAAAHALPERRLDAVVRVLAQRESARRKVEAVQTESGRQLASVSRDRKAVQITLDPRQTEAFGEYLIARLPELFTLYEREKGAAGSQVRTRRKSAGRA